MFIGATAADRDEAILEGANDRADPEANKETSSDKSFMFINLDCIFVLVRFQK